MSVISELLAISHFLCAYNTYTHIYFSLGGRRVSSDEKYDTSSRTEAADRHGTTSFTTDTNSVKEPRLARYADGALGFYRACNPVSRSACTS